MVCIATIFKFIFYLHLIHVCGLADIQDAISVEAHVEHYRFQLNCVVRNLTGHVDFKYPNKKLGYAHCIVPTPLTEKNNPDCHCNCTATPTCKCKITQNIDTGTTSLVLNDEVGLSKMFGTYTCLHGLDSMRFQVNDTAKPNYDEEKGVVIYIITTFIGWTLFFLLGLYHMYSIVVIRKGCQYGKVPSDDAEMQRPPGMDQFVENTHFKHSENNVGRELSIPCKTANCLNSSSIHKENNQEHNMCQMRYIACVLSPNIINCYKCNTIKAEQFCETCTDACCESCSKDHYHDESSRNEIAIIYAELAGAKRKKTKEIIKRSYTVSMKTKPSDRLTICGLTFISDGRLVIVDKCNKELLVYVQKIKKISETLIDEPRAMTFVIDNIIAITYGCKMRIRIYQIGETNINNLISINLSNLDMKPFSISYDEGLLAIEVGEGDYGKIIFLPKQVFLAEIPNNSNLDLYDEVSSPVEVVDGRFEKCIILKYKSIYADIPHVIDYAFFTGNTMRIALEVKNIDSFEGCIYISALSKKLVSCIDFQGTLVWQERILSPRGIHLVKQGYSENKHLIVASKRNGSIYGLNKNDGCTEVLLNGREIQSPRFISYNYNSRMLCSLEEESEFSIFHFEPTFSEKKPIEDTVILHSKRDFNAQTPYQP